MNISSRSRIHRARVAALCLAAVAGGLSACAKVGPPGGGPVDSTPPEVLSVRPADGRTRIAPDTRFELEFSEEMDRDSVTRALSILPDADLTEFEWRGPIVGFEPETALPDSSTVVLQIASTARDLHGVALASAVSFAFSTGSSVDRGVIAGDVTSAGSPVGGATVWACRGEVAADSLGVLRPCGYAGSTDPEGRFRVDYVAPSRRLYSLVAFVDENGDGRYESRTEDGVIAPRAAAVATPADSVGGLSLVIRSAEAESLRAEEEAPE